MGRAACPLRSPQRWSVIPPSPLPAAGRRPGERGAAGALGAVGQVEMQPRSPSKGDSRGLSRLGAPQPGSRVVPLRLGASGHC